MFSNEIGVDSCTPIDCEQSLFSQSSLSLAGLERANWPRRKRFARFSRSAFLARVTILRDCSQSSTPSSQKRKSWPRGLNSIDRSLMYNQLFSLFLLLDWIQPEYKIDNIFKKIDKRADTRLQLLTNYEKRANA